MNILYSRKYILFWKKKTLIFEQNNCSGKSHVFKNSFSMWEAIILVKYSGQFCRQAFLQSNLPAYCSFVSLSGSRNSFVQLQLMETSLVWCKLWLVEWKREVKRLRIQILLLPLFFHTIHSMNVSECGREPHIWAKGLQTFGQNLDKFFLLLSLLGQGRGILYPQERKLLRRCVSCLKIFGMKHWLWQKMTHWVLQRFFFLKET